MVAGHDHAVRCGVKRPRVLLEAVEHGDARRFQYLHLLLVRVLEKAHQVQGEVRPLVMKALGRVK